MALNQVIKFPSEQGNFDLTGNKNNIDFNLHGGSIYDLSKSYVAISIDVEQQCTTAGAAFDYIDKGPLHLGSFIDGTGGTNQANSLQTPTNACLVRNAFISSQRGGKIADLRRVDKYNYVKSLYKKSQEDMDNDLGGFVSKSNRSFYQVGAANEFNSLGNEISRQRTHDLRINLKDIIPFCRIDKYDGIKNGDTKIHLEMNFQHLKFSPSILNTGLVPVTSGSVAAGGAGSAADIGGTILSINMENITCQDAVANSRRTFTSTGKYGNNADIPFFVHQQVNISAVVSANGANVVDASPFRIEQITKDPATDRIVILLDHDLTNTGGAIPDGTLLNAITMTPLLATSSTIQIKNIELVAEVVNGESAPKGNVVYETVMSEEDNYPQTSSLNRVYEIPPMCKAVYIMFFRNGVDSLVSIDPHLKDYRFTIDNIEQVTHPVIIGDSRHKDLIQKIFMNNGETIQSIKERYYFNGLGNTGNGSNGKDKNYIIGQPTQFLQRSQKLQIELNASGGNLSGRHIIYYDVVKQM